MLLSPLCAPEVFYLQWPKVDHEEGRTEAGFTSMWKALCLKSASDKDQNGIRRQVHWDHVSSWLCVKSLSNWVLAYSNHMHLSGSNIFSCSVPRPWVAHIVSISDRMFHLEDTNAFWKLIAYNKRYSMKIQSSNDIISTIIRKRKYTGPITVEFWGEVCEL